MATFQTQLQNLLGAQDTPDTTAMTDWLTSGAREVLEILPPSKLMRIASNTNFTNNIDVEGKKVISVVRKDNNHSSKIYSPCRQLSPDLMGRVNDMSYMEAATESDPAYIIQNDVLNTYPASNSSNDSRVVYINSAITVSYNSSSIDEFPDEAEKAVVLYAARQYLQRLITDNEDEWYQIQYQMIDSEYKEAIKILQGGV